MDNQNTNLLLAVVLSIGIIAGWQYFYERPRLEAQNAQQKAYKESLSKAQLSSAAKSGVSGAGKAASLYMTAESARKISPRITFSNSMIKGSINLKGMRIDDLTFLNYKEDIGDNSPNIVLLNPNETSKSYFAEIGWIAGDASVMVPNDDSIWKCDKDNLKEGEVATCSWDNKKGITYRTLISLDSDYMFDIKQEIDNKSNQDVSFQSYGLIYKTFKLDAAAANGSIVHEGVSSVIDGELQENTYKEIEDKKKILAKDKVVDWFGVNDKYWLVALLPDKSSKYNTSYNFLFKNGLGRYQVDFVSSPKLVTSGSTLAFDHHLFGGAKELTLLDKYESTLGVKLFDRTVDFGWFYIITKPLLNILHFFHDLVGNFGVSIMIVTVLVKLAMFSLANRSYKSMKAMKELAPQLEQLKVKYASDQMKMNQEIMDLYKKHNVNPLSGCLPILIQIPVFFSLYKVLNVAIDMRHAPFFGWITDLSAPDPTNIFNLFGLIAFNPPSFLHIGLWPIFMALTMFAQQRMQPPPTDPAQAQAMQMMPVMFLFMFSGFPAGLLIYWAWNNILSIAQQSYINYSNDK